jgi:hypothetical protein
VPLTEESTCLNTNEIKPKYVMLSFRHKLEMPQDLNKKGNFFFHKTTIKENLNRNTLQ